MNERVFQVNLKDNVATALEEIESGMTVPVIGDARIHEIHVLDPIPKGHKVAVSDIKKDENIVKYGIVIGRATKDIKKGTWVHLNAMRSNYDERSSHLDPKTGAPLDTKYQ